VTPIQVENLIIGAGPSGLAAAACLKRRGLPHLILERDEPAATWRRHYERLHLHTARQFSQLPHHPMPESYPTYPSRAQVVAYLEDYAKALELDIRTGVTVTRAHREHLAPRDTGGWLVDTNQVRYRASRLIVASGYNASPVLPSWPGLDTFEGEVFHSSLYKNGAPYKGRDVLVVGAGNSGAEITIDLWEHGARPAMSVRSPVHVVPRDVFGVPAQTLAIALSRLPPKLADRLSLPMRDAVVGDLSSYGLHRPSRGPVELLEAEGRVPLVDIGTIALIKQGSVTVFPDISKIETSLAAMEVLGLVLQVHGEVTDADSDVFDRERLFIEEILAPLVARHPGLRVVLEHVTTAEGVRFVASAGANVGATITPHHLEVDRSAMFAGGLRPHLYCLPVPKTRRDRDALLEAAMSGHPRFFLGSDSAPHPRHMKEAACCAAGVYCGHHTLSHYADVFARHGALDRLEAFASEHGARFYGLPLNEDFITLEEAPFEVPSTLPFGDTELVPYRAGERLGFRVAPPA